jgi:hypothetical protein
MSAPLDGPKLNRDVVRKALQKLGITVRRTEHEEYRINYRGGAEATAYYTNELADALHTGVAMFQQHLERAPVAGNYMHDAELWGRCDRIILDESLPLAARAAASRKVDCIIGEQHPELTDEARVRAHAAVLRQMFAEMASSN